ncbi:hypothetical protein D9M70_573880 [compost metagenome]
MAGPSAQGASRPSAGQAAVAANTQSISASVCERWYMKQVAAQIKAIAHGMNGTISVSAGGHSRHSNSATAAATGSAG